MAVPRISASQKQEAPGWEPPQTVDKARCTQKKACMGLCYGDKYDFWTMIGAKREVAELMGEEDPDPSGNACEEKNTKSKEPRSRNSPSARKTKIVDGSGENRRSPS